MQSISSQQRLTAHYKTTLGALLAVSGAAGFTLSLWNTSQTSRFSPLVGVAVLLFGFGLYCLNRPYFLLEPRQLTVYNLLGSVSKRYTFDSWEVVKADSRRIYIDDDGITKKVSVLPWLASTKDWIAMRELLE
ncbi:MAG: hypothetical protein DCF25_19535 [Leptolyngbya foveolarum]|uniref:Uncharacterized protein n=1 Tax=Leptolyngbya foveolarum TaxID=47253 RepID=A0A2W4TX80_9CYAN|nr:MAG: hypothetical protein DCF25_19535 [Leptolyngbya foveolarum]